MDLVLSMDVLASVPLMLQVANALHDRPELQQPDNIIKAFGRYHKYLDLVVEHMTSPASDVFSWLPPIDVQMIWNAHLTRYNKYQSDCLFLYKQPLNPRLLDRQGAGSADAEQRARAAWEAKYPGEPFDLVPVIDASVEVQTVAVCTLKLKYAGPVSPFTIGVSEILEDLLWIRTYRSVPSPRTMNERYDAYLAFLRSTASAISAKSGERLPGTPIDVDALWHTHMLEPATYNQDLTNAFGFTFHHLPKSEVKSPLPPAATKEVPYSCEPYMCEPAPTRSSMRRCILS